MTDKSRGLFDQQLADLSDKIVYLSSMVVDAVGQAVMQVVVVLLHTPFIPHGISDQRTVVVLGTHRNSGGMSLEHCQVNNIIGLCK